MNIRRFFGFVITLFFQVSIPVILTLLGARLMMTSAYLNFEYNRPDFPTDSYGFTTADRLRYGPYALDYMVYDLPVEYLGGLRFPDGQLFYNDRELGHMVDVQKVARAAFTGLIVLLIAQIFLLVMARRYRWIRWSIWRGVIGGGVLTLLILVGAVLLIVIAWDQFFTQFHEVFFASGSWVFAYSDSLIRLYPIKFWQDTAINIGVFAGVGALTLLALAWRFGRRDTDLNRENHES